MTGPTSKQAPTIQPQVAVSQAVPRVSTAQVRAAIPPAPLSARSCAQALFVDPAPSDFVSRRASDGMLELGGTLYFGAGTNIYGLAAQKEFYGDASYLRQLFTAFKAEGVNVMRIWCVKSR